MKIQFVDVADLKTTVAIVDIPAVPRAGEIVSFRAAGDAMTIFEVHSVFYTLDWPEETGQKPMAASPFFAQVRLKGAR